MCSVVSDSVTPWTVAHQAPLSMGFSRPEYWSELPFPSPGDLPDPGIKLLSPEAPALADRFFFLTPSHLYTFDLHSAVCQLYLNKTVRKQTNKNMLQVSALFCHIYKSLFSLPAVQKLNWREKHHSWCLFLTPAERRARLVRLIPIIRPARHGLKPD